MTSPARSFTCTYNAANLVTWQAFSDGRTNTFAYDAAYRLTNASSVGAGSSCVCASYAYDAVGNLTNVSSGGAQATASALQYQYDAANQRTFSCLHINNQQSAISNWYLYDLLGRLTAITNGFLTAQYVYDEAGNMTGKTVAAVGGSTPVVSGYSYDVLDRLINLASSIQYPESNALVASYTYTYEVNRSLITSITDSTAGVRSFVYDPARQLTQENGTVLRYDAAGRLIDEASSNIIHNYSPGNIQTWMQVVTNSGYANLNIRCDSRANIADWTVEANGVSAVSSNYAGTYTSFQITNVPLTTTCSWVTVKLDSRTATDTSSEGWFDWASTNLQPTGNCTSQSSQQVNQVLVSFP